VEDTGDQGVMPMEPEERYVAQVGSSRSTLQEEPAISLRGGGDRRPVSPCEQCKKCGCRRARDYTAAQESPSPTSRSAMSSRRRSTSSHCRSSSSRRRPRSPKRNKSPGPPQLWRELAQQDGKWQEEIKSDEGGSTLFWADAQEQFSLGRGP